MAAQSQLSQYYLAQAGGGFGQYYAGSSYQKGYGIGSWLGGLFRTVLPILRSGAVAVGRERNNTMIRITDEGAGLSPEDLGRLFGRFQRLSAKPTGGESSTGLGLSIVKRIIDMHGGQVTAESAGPGRGSTFTVILPATELS